VPVVDALDESAGLDDVLAFGVDFALADDDGLFVALDEGFVVAADSWLCVGAELVQLGLGAAWALFVADPLGLGPVLALDDFEGDPDGDPLGLTLGVAVPLGLPLGLADPLGLPLTVLPLLEPPLADVAGAVTVTFVLLGTLVGVSLAEGRVDVDGQALSERCVITAPAELGGGLCGEATGDTVPWFSVAPGLGEELMLRAAPMASPTCTIA
jgi:hypothetical protein